MPFAFLAPLFLAGAMLIAIPVIVHLTHKEKQEVQRFPSLMFVRQIPYRSTRKQRIRHWFLLLLRALALILIAAAFARPFMEKDPLPLPAGTGARELVILLDRSASMGYQGRWEAAARAAAGALNSVESGDRTTLVLFDENAEALRAEEGDLAPLRTALKNAKVGAMGTRYAPPLRLAQSALQTSTLPRKEVLLITDLQRNGWNAREAIELPVGTRLDITDVGSEVGDNVTVAGVTFARARFAGRERVTATARVLNRGKDPVTTQVALDLNSREIERKPLTIAPNQAGMVQFTEFTLAGTNLRGTITAGSDVLPADNRFYFVLSPGQVAPVSLVRAPGAKEEETLYLENALSASGEPSFDVTIHGQTVPDEALRNGGVVIINDVIPTGGDARRLARFVEGGGGLLIVGGSRTRDWDGAAKALMPGDVGGFVERETGTPGRIATLQYGHRVFEAFRSPRAGDFTSLRFYRYRTVKPAPEDIVLARFDDGLPALIERRVGAGRVLFWTSTFDNTWNDAPVQPVFAPFLREAATYLSGSGGESVWRTAGEILDIAPLLGGTAAKNREIVVAAPSGERLNLEAAAGSFLPLTEQGFYQLRIPGQTATRAVAVNLNLAESDLTRVTAQEIRDAVVDTRASTAATSAQDLTPAENERRQSLWWYLLLGSVLLLAAESIISNRLSRVARA